MGGDMMNSFVLAQQGPGTGQFLFAIAGSLCSLFLPVLLILIPVKVGQWKIFEKAGENGYAAIIPLYSLWVLVKISNKSNPLWFIFLLFPGINFIAAIILHLDLADRFGKGAGYGLGLTFLAPVFYPILGFGDSRYGGRF